MEKANYLQACSIYYLINNVRMSCLDQFVRVAQKKEEGYINPIPISYLQNLLYFNNCRDLLIYLEMFGLDISELNFEDPFEEETKLQTSFVSNWTVYSNRNRNQEQEKNLLTFMQKSKKIDEKKLLKKFPPSAHSKENVNYYNNDEVSRKFLMNGGWKQIDSIDYEKNLIFKICENNKYEQENISKPKVITPKKINNNNPTPPQPISITKQNSMNQPPIIAPLNLIKKPSLTTKPIEPNPTKNNKIVDTEPNLFITFPTPREIQNNNFSAFDDSHKTITKIESVQKREDPNILIRKENALNSFINERQNKIKENCFGFWYNYKEKILRKKQLEKREIGKIFDWTFRPNRVPQKKENLDNLQNSYQNFMGSLSSEKTSNDFISEIAHSLFRQALPNQTKIFFKICIFPNTLDDFARDLSQNCQEAFCGDQKKITRRKFNFKIDETTEKEVLYCVRMMTPLNEIIIDDDPTKKMSCWKNVLKGSDVLVFVVTENFYEDAGYFKMFKHFLDKCGLEEFKLIFLRVSHNNTQKSKMAMEKTELIQKFGLQENYDNEKNFKIITCETDAPNKAFLNKVSAHLKKIFQKSIRDDKLRTIKFPEIFSNLYHVLKTQHGVEAIDGNLNSLGYKSYFYNKNLVNSCLGKFYQSFSKSLGEFYEIPDELITVKEKKRLMKIKKQRDILLFLLKNCFLDEFDKKYRKMIKNKIGTFFDYSILEEILLKYLRGFALFEDDQIFEALNKYMVPLYEYFNYQQGYGISFKL